MIDPKIKGVIFKQILLISNAKVITLGVDKKVSEQYEYNLSDESIIKKFGYNTSLWREEQWKVLINRVIPTVGLDKSIKHLSFLIKKNNNRNNLRSSSNLNVYI